MGHHQWIWIITRFGSSWGIITGFGSSLDLDHHWTSSLDLDHHWKSSLDLDHHCWIIITGSRSSLDLDHHCIWIITTRSSSLNLDHHWCYLMILLVTGSSIEPTLFHAGCRPSLHIGLLQHLYLTYSSERHSTHIHPGWNHILPQWWKIYVLPSRRKPHPTIMME